MHFKWIEEILEHILLFVIILLSTDLAFSSIRHLGHMNYQKIFSYGLGVPLFTVAAYCVISSLSFQLIRLVIMAIKYSKNLDMEMQKRTGKFKKMSDLNLDEEEDDEELGELGKN